MATMVSIDSSTRCSGIACFVDGELKSHGIINLSNERDVEQRSNDMGLTVMKNLDFFAPSMVYVERPRGRNNPQVLRKLATIIGMIRGYCIYRGIYFQEVAPTEWRKVLGFKQGKNVKRDEEKAQSIQYVKEKYNIDPETDDEADAICIGAAMFTRYAKIAGGQADEN